MPITHFISVLLPLPLVPSSTTVSPPAIRIETSSSTRTAPYEASIPSTMMLLALGAKVRSHHARVLQHLLRQSVSNLLAGNEHDQALRKGHHRPHDVLDHDDGDAALVEPDQQLDDVLHFRMRQPCHRFVGDQQFRF